MNKEKKRLLRLGIMAIVATVLLIASIFLVGSKKDYFTRSITVHAYFKDVNGLRKGDFAYYSGVRVGVVSEVSLENDTTIKVGLQIRTDIKDKIRNNAVVSIGSEGLVGNKRALIKPQPGKGETLKDGDVLVARNPIDTDKILRRLTDLNDEAESIVSNLAGFTEKLNQDDGLAATLLRDTIIGSSIKNSALQLEAATAQIPLLLSDLRSAVAPVNETENVWKAITSDTLLPRNLQSSLSNVTEMSDQLLKASQKLSKVLENLDKGVSGVLLNDTTTAAHLRSAIEDVSESADKFNENMEALQHSWPFRRYFRKKAKEEKEK